MAGLGRRKWLRTVSRAVSGAAFAACAPSAAWSVDAGEPVKFRLGLVVDLAPDVERAIARVHDFGLPACCVRLTSPANATARSLRAALDKFTVEATAAIFSGPGKEAYDFYEGPETLGLVPRATRAARVAHLKAMADFAASAGIPAIQGRIGFLPENPNDPLYRESIAALREVARYCAAQKIAFRCQTGTETPLTLIRAIRDASAAGAANIGVAFDPAGLVMYGKANAADAARMLGTYTQAVIAKDAGPPDAADPSLPGEEFPIGYGLVEWPLVIQRLRQAKYAGSLTIECGMAGDRQTDDIWRSIDYLSELMI